MAPDNVLKTLATWKELEENTSECSALVLLAGNAVVPL